MGIGGLVSKRFKNVERPREPTAVEVLRGPPGAGEPLSAEAKAGLALQGKLITRQVNDEWARYENEKRAKAAAEHARDEAILARRIS